MAKSAIPAKRRMLVDKNLTELSLLAKELCPGARIEASLESFEDEDGHLRVYPPAEITGQEVEEIEAKIADRCIDLLVRKGIFICSAVYD